MPTAEVDPGLRRESEEGRQLTRLNGSEHQRGKVLSFCAIIRLSLCHAARHPYGPAHSFVFRIRELRRKLFPASFLNLRLVSPTTGEARTARAQ